MYEKQEWENGRDFANAERMTHIEDGIYDNSINIEENSRFYKEGDTYTSAQNIYVSGCVTSSLKWLVFSLQFPKSLKNIRTITVNGLTATGRTTNGAYLNGASSGINFNDTGISLQYFKSNDNSIMVRFVSENAYTNVVNNTPVSVELKNINITFHE